MHKDEADDFRRLCIAVDASYLTDRNELAAALKTIGHEIHDAVQKSTFQEPAFFVSESQARNEVFFVIRGTASMKDALTDGDCAPEDLNSALPEFAGVKAHRGMAKSAHALLDKHASKILKCVEMFELKKKKPRFVVLGHSLGAGTAAIASILLKEKLGKTPVECVAFATPPCLDVKGCVASAAHLKSIVCHDDVVVRASRQNVDDLFSRIQGINWKEDFSKDVNKLHTVQAAKAASVTLASMQKSAASAAASFAEQAKRRLASSTQGKGNKNVEAAKAAAGAAASVAAAGAAKAAAGASALAGKFSSMMSKRRPRRRRRRERGGVRACGSRRPLRAREDLPLQALAPRRRHVRVRDTPRRPDPRAHRALQLLRRGPHAGRVQGGAGHVFVPDEQRRGEDGARG